MAILTKKNVKAFILPLCQKKKLHIIKCTGIKSNDSRIVLYHSPQES